MRGAAGKDWSFPAAGSKDGEALASELVSEQKRKAAATSALVAAVGKLMVFETPLSLYR